MAVPGNVLSGRNRGGHALIRDGAKIVESADDILEELGWTGLVGPAPSASDCAAAGSGDALLLAMQPGVPYDPDDIARLVSLGTRDLLARLTALELSGHLKRAEGGRFVRAI